MWHCGLLIEWVPCYFDDLPDVLCLLRYRFLYKGGPVFSLPVLTHVSQFGGFSSPVSMVVDSTCGNFSLFLVLLVPLGLWVKLFGFQVLLG